MSSKYKVGEDGTLLRKRIQIVVAVLFVFSSCNRYFDISQKNSYPFTKGGFQCYPDSNVYNYNSSVGLKRDTEISFPKKFSLVLPKRIAYYEAFGATSFAFYFEQKQTLAIIIDLEQNNVQPDTVIMLESETQLDKHFPRYSFMGSNRLHDINNKRFKHSRKSCVIYQGGDRLLLLNIESKNFIKFLGAAESFKTHQ